MSRGLLLPEIWILEADSSLPCRSMSLLEENDNLQLQSVLQSYFALLFITKSLSFNPTSLNLWYMSVIISHQLFPHQAVCDVCDFKNTKNGVIRCLSVRFGLTTLIKACLVLYKVNIFSLFESSNWWFFIVANFHLFCICCKASKDWKS